jgi:hypothetical protein
MSDTNQYIANTYAARILDATTGGRSVILVSGGSTGDVLTLQEDGTYLPETLGSAAGAEIADFATAAQGALADSALQPDDIASGTITPRDDDINLSGGSIGDVITVQADGSLALSTPAGGAESPLTLTASTATEVPLTIQGAASQTGNLQEWKNSAGTVIVNVNSSGTMLATGYTLGAMGGLVKNSAVPGISYYGAVKFTFNDAVLSAIGGFNVGGISGFGSAGGTVGIRSGGSGILRITNAAGTSDAAIQASTANLSAVPTSDPAVAGALWNDSGTLKISAG